MLRRVSSVAILVATVWVTFSPALGFSFLNWDDNLVIVENAALAQPGVVRWAFTTTYMEHYQPGSWLLWALLRGTGQPNPTTYHAANLVLHGAVVLLVWLVAHTLFASGQWGRSADPVRRRGLSPVLAAAITALLFGVHPLRVEVIAWISAMPYALATMLALASTLVWLRDVARTARVSWIGLALFAASLLARPLALGLPLVFAVLDHWRFARTPRLSVLRALPFAALSVAAASVEFVARAPAAAEVPWAYRLQSALTAPYLYVWRTLVPLSLTPLDVLPLDPVGDPVNTLAAALGLIAVTTVGWLARRRVPALLAGWIAYLALLAPAAGLVPSGLQASADRYAYLPGIVLAIGVTGAGAAWLGGAVVRGRFAALAAVATIVALAFTARDLLAVWSDSITLWTRVVTLDSKNDAGLYNLAVALSNAGQADAAAERYRAVLAVNPLHADARANLNRLDAARLEREANALAGAGRLSEAADRYEVALARDPRLAHSQAARGMALATLGRSGEAIPHLSEALRLGVDDVAVANTLAGLLVETGAAREARTVLERALAAHPNEAGLAHNLARLLMTFPGPSPEDLMRALQLSEGVVQATGSQDARALDTLATALAANGRMDDAREMNARAAAVATAQGDDDLAVEITARGQSYR